MILLRNFDFFPFQNFHTFSIFYAHFDQIQNFFKVLKTDFEIQYFQYRVGTLLTIRMIFVLTVFVTNDSLLCISYLTRRYT